MGYIQIGNMQESNYLLVNRELVNDLKKIPTLSPLKDYDLHNLLQMSKLRKYEAGGLICQEGHNDIWIYFLIKGSVRIVKEGKVLAIFDCRGDVFGEMSVIDGAPRSASVYAVDAAVCLATNTN